MKTIDIRYRRADLYDPVSCIGRSVTEPCEDPATWCRQWQTNAMSAPAFWYLCEEHAREIAEGEGITLP